MIGKVIVSTIWKLAITLMVLWTTGEMMVTKGIGRAWYWQATGIILILLILYKPVMDIIEKEEN